MKIIKTSLYCILCLILAAASYAIYHKKAHIWLPSYIGQKLVRPFERRDALEPIHVMFAFVDHFEPFVGGVSLKEAKARMQRWRREYPVMAQKHKDADGKIPQHTWFYPQDMIQEDLYFLRELVKMQGDGLGEIEMHLHHANDTAQSFKQKVGHWKSSVGIAEGGVIREHFAYVAGNWALDNSRLENGRNYSGVNNEIEILRDFDCYADLTFPSIGLTSQPSMPNTIYYATDHPQRPKSYDTGIRVEVGKKQEGDLMLIQGPLQITWYKALKRLKPSFDDGNVCETFLPFKERVDTWVKSNIHVKGQPNWIFIKVHTHGCENEIMPVVLGKPRDDMHTYLETQYNDSENYVLHYVTAREMYNIIKAAEAGKKGDPNQYRDYMIKPYRK